MTLGFSRAVSALLGPLGVAWCLGASPARAQEPDAGTRMAARELAVSGAEAFESHDFVIALDRFKRAESLYKVPSISVMIARCFARLGRVVEAVDKYEETLRAPLDPGAPEAFQRAVAEAAAEVEAVRGRVARLELRLPADAPASAVVTLDDKPVPAALLGVPTPVNPGVHRLTARAPGRAAYNFDLNLPEGGRQTVEITLASRSAEPVAATPPAPRASRTGASPLTIALLAGGGVAIAGGAVLGVTALGHKSSLDAACKPGCPASLSDDLTDFRRDRALSYVGFGVGIAAAGAGAYLLLHESSSGGEVGALVLPGGAAISGRF